MTTCDRWIVALLAAICLASTVFLGSPAIDPATSALFFNHGHFMFEKRGLGAVFTVYVHFGMRVLFCVYALIGLLRLTQGGFRDVSRLRAYALVILSVGLAAGLITNFVLKDHWGRARPVQILQFGGTAKFTPAWMISDQCRTNCAFVGGDVSFAFCALAAALTATRSRTLWIVVSIAAGTVVAFGRIAAGAHFLSDCVFAALLTSLTVLILYRIIYIPHFP